MLQLSTNISIVTSNGGAIDDRTGIRSNAAHQRGRAEHWWNDKKIRFAASAACGGLGAVFKVPSVVLCFVTQIFWLENFRPLRDDCPPATAALHEDISPSVGVRVSRPVSRPFLSAPARHDAGVAVNAHLHVEILGRLDDIRVRSDLGNVWFPIEDLSLIICANPVFGDDASERGGLFILYRFLPVVFHLLELLLNASCFCPFALCFSLARYQSGNHKSKQQRAN